MDLLHAKRGTVGHDGIRTELFEALSQSHGSKVLRRVGCEEVVLGPGDLNQELQNQDWQDTRFFHFRDVKEPGRLFKQDAKAASLALRRFFRVLDGLSWVSEGKKNVLLDPAVFDPQVLRWLTSFYISPLDVDQHLSKFSALCPQLTHLTFAPPLTLEWNSNKRKEPLEDWKFSHECLVLLHVYKADDTWKRHETFWERWFELNTPSLQEHTNVEHRVHHDERTDTEAGVEMEYRSERYGVLSAQDARWRRGCAARFGYALDKGDGCDTSIQENIRGRGGWRIVPISIRWIVSTTSNS